MTTQKRSHAGHGHHHHHHHDNVYLTSKNKSDAGVRITRIGLLVNLAMAIGKFLGGYFFHSQALVADAYHALTDLVSDFMTLGTVAWSLKPPSERFPNGYGKVESLGALGVSSLLLCGGVFMGLNAGQVLLSQFYPDAFEALQHAGLLVHGHSHGHDHNAEVLGPNINAAWLAAGSIVVKEWLYRATMKIAKERKSSVLASNAIHHRIDSLTSIVALATIAGAHIFKSAAWLDPVGGLVISLMVIQAGWGNTKTALLELADTTVDDEIKDSVRRATSKTLAQVSRPGDVELRDIQGMKSGQNYLMEIELAVPGSWTVEQFRHIEETLRQAIGSKVRGVRRVKVRAVPRELSNVSFIEEFIPGDVSPRSSPEPEENGHNHQHNGNTNNGVHKRH
ncbi:putative cation efflux family protein [Talaromyces proteolyticus]|uniref:Cation efflux family protein n=1 Tax=Talaromyces proteolyticus TaxID=1131652 RepID=A0AAD4Q2W3_9EURO|nr:putative cation efflux family protein [Talaromyces proteolyticus]KAH8700763.1 putative cation efflux family protein [Talaromyces proteolyticus]